MIDNKDDQIYGFAAVAVAFGWGDLEVKEILPEKKLRIRVNDSYEASGYLEHYGTATKGKCHMFARPLFFVMLRDELPVGWKFLKTSRS
jgi:hypothetical protein